MKSQAPAKNFIGSNAPGIEKYLREHSFSDMCMDLGLLWEIPGISMKFENCPFCNAHDIQRKTVTVPDGYVRRKLDKYRDLISDDIHLYSTHSFCGQCGVLLDVQHQFIDNSFQDPDMEIIHKEYMYHLMNSLKRPYPHEVFANRVRGAGQSLFFDFNPGNTKRTISANILYRAIYNKYAHEPPTLSLIPKNAL